VAVQLVADTREAGESCDQWLVRMWQMTVAGMDEECIRSIQESKTLARIFQSVVDDCKVNN
jgi:hypothetical protein